jgi:Tol biopolymer transport system component
MIENGGLPCWSPDGSSIAFVEREHLSLCTWNFSTGALKGLFSESGKVPLPGGWWNDGKSIIIALMDLKTRESVIMRIYTDGRDPEQIPCEHDGFYRYLALSPDCSLLMFAAMEANYLGLYIMSSTGGKYLPLTISDEYNEGPVWSPDGMKIAFSSSRSGTGNVWIMDINAERIKNELQNLR